MKLETQLFEECKRRSLNCSLTYQSVNSYSVEIYTGYKMTYCQVFYFDGYTDKSKLIKEALKFLKTIK